MDLINKINMHTNLIHIYVSFIEAQASLLGYNNELHTFIGPRQSNDVTFL
jgi:hypothetical protein